MSGIFRTVWQPYLRLCLSGNHYTLCLLLIKGRTPKRQAAQRLRIYIQVIYVFFFSFSWLFVTKLAQKWNYLLVLFKPIFRGKKQSTTKFHYLQLGTISLLTVTPENKKTGKRADYRQWHTFISENVVSCIIVIKKHKFLNRVMILFSCRIIINSWLINHE